MKTHQKTGTPTYWSWLAMRVRCSNPKSDSYPNYGGRGISVCARWGAFENFLADMGERPDGMTIERTDSNGNYEPGNCVWATRMEQNKNKRSNLNVTIGGETLCLKDWCRRLGLRYNTIHMRVFRGSSCREALGLEVTK